MVLQVRTLLDGEVQTSNDATRIIKLPKSGKMHALIIKASCTNGATSCKGVNIHDALDLIEVYKDGSKPLFSLIPKEFEKWYEWTYGKALPMVETEEAAGVQSCVYPILFGRDIFDPEMYLPLKDNVDLELRLKFSPTISATVGFATGTMTFDVIALISTPDTSLNYRGTLINRTIKTFTSAASGDEEVDIPRGDILKQILIYAYEAGVEDGTDITDILLEWNDGEYRHVSANWDEMQETIALLKGAQIEHHGRLLKSDTDTFYTRLGHLMGLGIQVLSDNDIANDLEYFTRPDTLTGDMVTLNSAQGKFTAGSEDLTAYTTDHAILWRAIGRNPGHSVLIPFDYQPDPITWLQTRNLSNLKLILTQGGADAAVRVSTVTLEQL